MRISFTASILAVLFAAASAAPPTAPAQGKQPATSVYASSPEDLFLASVNVARAKYGAKSLSWNVDLFNQATKTASSCQATPAGSYGVLLAYNSNAGDSQIQHAVNYWIGSAKNYFYDQPGFTKSAAPFTAFVWKSATEVGCATATCPAGTFGSKAQTTYIVCAISPLPNVGDFVANVGKKVIA